MRAHVPERGNRHPPRIDGYGYYSPEAIRRRYRESDQQLTDDLEEFVKNYNAKPEALKMSEDVSAENAAKQLKLNRKREKDDLIIGVVEMVYGELKTTKSAWTFNRETYRRYNPFDSRYKYLREVFDNPEVVLAIKEAGYNIEFSDKVTTKPMGWFRKDQIEVRKSYFVTISIPDELLGDD